MRNTKTIALLAFGMASAAGMGHAATETASMAVTATVVDTCDVAVDPLAFGTIDRDEGGEKTTTLTVTCTEAKDLEIVLDGGTDAQVATPFRQMKDATTNKLPYKLGFTDGTDHAPNLVKTHSATASANEITLYGKIDANPSYVAGDYNDTVIITVAY